MAPLIFGIAGGSGSGKTTIAQKIAAAVPSDTVSIIEHDAYYRDRQDLTFDERCQLNFDHPESLETELLIEHLRHLRAGEAIEAPIYDFKTHRRQVSSRPVLPTPVIIVEGILALVDADLRALLDVKIYVDTDADIRAFRRIRRDIEQRGRTFDSVREQYYRSVRPMHLQYVEPSKRWADLIIPEGGENRVALDLIASKLRSVILEHVN
ncbi:MAG: uridine kinase [Myxococcales bacterium]|nr:uridine kinase [Myxococcales bacterium]MCB9565727.1 uridine kinase [Myxococcales bacterium]MCB9703127.1 uridine kinase [Myxococcales bacterium]